MDDFYKYDLNSKLNILPRDDWENNWINMGTALTFGFKWLEKLDGRNRSHLHSSGILMIGQSLVGNIVAK